VRPLLHSYGIRLPNRVRVELTALTELEQRAGRPLHGMTVTEYGPGGWCQVVELRVADGLPATQFGQVLAHEMGHAWLAGCPGSGRPAEEEEGICELLGSWWLLARGGRLAAHLLDRLSTNPDPVYGQGFRDVHRRAHGVPPAGVVSRIGRTGQL
jgi:hypothetical protein